MAGRVEGLLERVEDFRPHAHGFAEAFGADRHDHEFLEIDRIVGMCAAIDDIHHGHRQCAGGGAADITIERQTGRLGRRTRDCEGDTQDGIGAEAGLVGRAVQIDHCLVDLQLVFGFQAADSLEDLAIDGINGVLNALAHVTVTTVTQFNGFMSAGGGARRNCGAAKRAVFQEYVDLNGRVAAAVENLTADDIDNGGHGLNSLSRVAELTAPDGFRHLRMPVSRQDDRGGAPHEKAASKRRLK